MGDQVEASSTTMEAAEQLIQLSGGGEEDESESRSADSVKGDGKEGVPAVVESSSAGKRREIKSGGGEDDEAVMGGVQRRRPRFRSLAEIYRVTKRIDLVPCHEETEEEEEGSSKGKKKKKNMAAGGAAHDEAIVPAAPSKGRRVVRMQKK